MYPTMPMRLKINVSMSVHFTTQFFMGILIWFL